MKKNSLPCRAVSVVLSTLLAFTLVPSAALAAGTDALTADVDTAAPTDVTDASDASSSSEPDQSASDINASSANDAASSAIINEQHAVNTSATDDQSTAADDMPEILRAAVQVQAGNDQAATLLSYSGMSFQLTQNAEGALTATLVGFSTTPTGALDIPAQIEKNGTTYTVTSISAHKELRGEETPSQSDPADVDPTQIAADGESASSAPADSDSTTKDESGANVSVNPYAAELYTDAQKAPGVTSISIPASVTTIDPGFFQLFPNATAISVAADNSAFTSYNGMLFGTNDAGEPTNLLLVPEGLEGNAVLPDSLAHVPVCTFSRCSKLTAIHVASGSTGASALEGMSFTSRDGILYKNNENDETGKSASDEATSAENGESLTLVAVPAGIGTSVKIAPECSIIAEGAFWGNDALRTIVVSGDVEGIEVNPVFDPSARTNQSNGAVDTNANTADTPTAPVPAFMLQTVEGATVVLADNAARGTWEAAGFTRFAQPAQPGAMTGPAWGNSGLAYTLLDDFTLAVRWQGDGAATTVEIPAQAEIDSVAYSVSTIDEGAFQDQTDLTSITIPSSVTTIGAHAFQGCTALEDVAVPGSVSQLPESAFQDALALRQVTLGEGVQAIGTSAFENTALETIFIPRSVRTVESNAFARCQNLQAIVALGSVDEVSPAALADTSGASVYVPFDANEDYAWTTGLPTSGNHLLPYGVKMAGVLFQLEEGQSADLFANGGYVYASDQAQLQVSYKGKAVTADTNGTVTAKMPGSSTVTASVVFQDRTLTAATCTVKVVHAAVEDGEGVEGGEDGEGGADDGAEDDEVDDANADTGSDADQSRPPRPDMVSQDVPLQTEVTEDPIEVEPTEPKRPTMVSQDVTVEIIDPVEIAANEDKSPTVPTADIMFNETVQLMQPGNGADAEAEAEATAALEAAVEADQDSAEQEITEPSAEEVLVAASQPEETAEAMDSVEQPEIEQPETIEDDPSSEEVEDSQDPDRSPVYEVADEPVFEDQMIESLQQTVSQIASLDPQTDILGDLDEEVVGDEAISLLSSGMVSRATSKTKRSITINPNGGRLVYFYLPKKEENTNNSWAQKYALGDISQRTTAYTFNHYGGGTHGPAGAHGYFHTIRTNNSLDSTQNYGEINGTPSFRFSVQAHRTGYQFAKWTNNGKKSTGETVNLANGTTIVANWTANSYTITFNGNGATSGSMDPLTMKYDTPKYLSANKFVRPGYEHIGWSTSPTTGTTFNYGPGAQVKNLTTTNGVTIPLYAVWRLNPKVTWNANGGAFSNGATTDQAEYLTGATVPVHAAPTRTGYQFMGWSTNPSAASGTTSGSMTTNITAAVTYYATWKAINYVVTFDSKGGTFTSSSISGWYSNAACTTPATTTSGVVYRTFTILTNGIDWPDIERKGWAPCGVVYSGDLVSGKGSGIKDFIAGVPALQGGLGGTGWWGNLTVTAAWTALITVQCSKPTLSPSGTNNSDQMLHYYDFSNGTKFFSKDNIVGEWGAASLTKLTQTTATQWITSIPKADGYTLNGFYEEGVTPNGLRISSNGRFYAAGTIAGNVTWKAQWTATTYTMTVSAEHGSFTSGLTGWYSNASCTTAATTSSTTVYRKFTIEDSATRTFPTARRTSGSWTFCGWQLTGDLVTNCSSKISTSYSGNSTYVAGNPLSTSFTSITGTGWYGTVMVRAVWRTTLTINCNVPSDATGLSNTGTKYIYYYNWYKNDGASSFFSKYSTSGHTITTTASNSTNKLDTNAGSVWVASTSLPSSSNYILKGFYTDKTGGTETLTSGGALRVTTTSISGATTWYAQWLEEYTITLDLNGGTWRNTRTDPIEITYTQSSTDTAFYNRFDENDFFTPSRSGATFVGWRFVSFDNTITSYTHKKSDGTLLMYEMYEGIQHAAHYICFGKYTSVSGNLKPGYGNITLCAVWRFDVQLDQNIPADSLASFTEGSTKTVPYYTDHGFCSPLYKGSLKYTEDDPQFFGSYSWWLVNDSNIAQWKAALVPSDSSGRWVFKGFRVTLPGGTLTAIEDTGHLGKSMATGYDSYIGNASYRTWTAQWERQAVTLRLDPNTGYQNNTTTIVANYGEDRAPDDFMSDYYGNTQHIPIPTKSGWDFDGYYCGSHRVYYWHVVQEGHNYSKYLYSDNNFTETIDALRQNNDTWTFTLTAKWTRNITLNFDGGKNADGASSTTLLATYGEPLPAKLLSSQLATVGPQNSPTGVTWNRFGYYHDRDKFYTESTNYYDRSGNRTYNAAITTLQPATIYVMWTRTINFNGNGSDGGVDVSGKPITNPRSSLTFSKGYLPGFSNVHARSGYRLTGYFTEPTGGTKVCNVSNNWASWIDSNAATTTPATIYAQWERLEAYIVFDANGGTGAPEKMTGYPGETISNRTLPTQTPTRDDYTFAGWYTAEEGGSPITQLPATFAEGTTTYYAHWTEKPLSAITIKACNGDEFEDEEDADLVGTGGFLLMSDGDLVTEHTWNVRPDTGTISAVKSITDVGFKLVGWYSEDANGNRTLLSTAESWAPTRPTTGWPAQSNYVVVFQMDTYSISYRCVECGALDHDAQNPCKHVISIADLPTEFNYYDTVVVDPPFGVDAPQMQPYYDFQGWTGTDVSDNDKYAQWIPIEAMGDKTYTINVQPHRYTLRLNSTPGVWNGTAPTGWQLSGTIMSRGYTVEDAPFELPLPQRNGYSFNHWECDRGSGQGQDIYPGSPQRLDTTFTPSTTAYGSLLYDAAWTDDPYQISYVLSDDLGTGTLPEGQDNPLAYSAESDDITLPIPSRIGYDFTGWTEEEPSNGGLRVLEGDTPQIEVVIPHGSWGNRQFVAHWRAYEYDVTYDLDNGRWEAPEPENPQPATYDQDVTIEQTVPKRTGYIFKCWQLTYDTLSGTVIQNLEPGQTLTRANLVAIPGVAAYPDVPINRHESVTVEAVWIANLSVDVVVGSEGVHMGVQLKGGTTRDPFETTDGTAMLRNRSDGALKVVSVTPNASSDYDALKANALQLFCEEENLTKAQFTVRPSRGNAATMQVGTFGIADAERSLTLVDDTAYSSPDVDATGPNHARNWMMEAAGSGNEYLQLVYRLDMGTLQPNDIDLSDAGGSQLYVADLVYKVALVLP